MNVITNGKLNYFSTVCFKKYSGEEALQPVSNEANVIVKFYSTDIYEQNIAQ